MKLKVKKIIAREFLILTIVIVLGILTFLLTYPYNSFQEHQANKLNSIIIEKGKLADSLSQHYKSKLDNQNWFFDKYSNKFDISGFEQNTKEKVWKRLFYLAKTDSIKYKWEKVWDKYMIAFNKEIGFETPEKFKEFIDENLIDSTDIAVYKSSLIIKDEITKLTNEKSELNNKVLDFDEKIAFTFRFLIIFVILFFVLRYILYGIKWSIKTLKEK